VRSADVKAYPIAQLPFALVLVVYRERQPASRYFPFRMYPAGTHLVPGGQPAAEAGRGAVAATGGGVIGSMPPDCIRANSWALSCAALSAPLAGAAITATTIAIRNTCLITSTLASLRDQRLRSPGVGCFCPDFPNGPTLRWYRARLCLSRQLVIPHSPDARGFAASIALLTGFDNGNSPS